MAHAFLCPDGLRRVPVEDRLPRRVVSELAAQWHRGQMVKAKAWALLIQTPRMARMVPHQHRLDVLMAGVAGWGSEVGLRSAPKMAQLYHEALGV